MPTPSLFYLLALDLHPQDTKNESQNLVLGTVPLLNHLPPPKAKLSFVEGFFGWYGFKNTPPRSHHPSHALNSLKSMSIPKWVSPPTLNLAFEGGLLR